MRERKNVENKRSISIYLFKNAGQENGEPKRKGGKQVYKTRSLRYIQITVKLKRDATF